jgi:hypothetical protein
MSQRDSPQEDEDKMIETLKELNKCCQGNEWRSRYESLENLFEVIRSHPDIFNGPNKQTIVVETADSIAKLINDPNAKI